MEPVSRMYGDLMALFRWLSIPHVRAPPIETARDRMIPRGTSQERGKSHGAS